MRKWIIAGIVLVVIVSLASLGDDPEPVAPTAVESAEPDPEFTETPNPHIVARAADCVEKERFEQVVVYRGESWCILVGVWNNPLAPPGLEEKAG